MKNLLIPFTFLLTFSSFNLFSFTFNPRLSILGSYTNYTNFIDIQSGPFIFENRKVNFGFEITHDFKIFNDWLIRSGIQYKTYKKTFHGLNQIPEAYDIPYPFSWQHSFLTLTVPIFLVKQFEGNRNFQVYGGGTIGIHSFNESKQLLASREHKDPSVFFPIYREIKDTTTLNQPFKLIGSLNVGASICPFPSIPRFTAGFQIGAQLMRNSFSSYNAKAIVVARQETQIYAASHEMRMIDFTTTLTYTFGRKNKKLEGNQFTTY